MTILSCLLFFVSVMPVDAIETVVEPSSLRQGDAFLVRVTGLDVPPDDAEFLGIKLPFSPCGERCFLAVGAVPLKTAPGSRQVRITTGTKTIRVHCTVRKAGVKTVRITVPREKVELAKKDLERADSEEERLKAIWPVVSGMKWAGRFALPLENELSTPFGAKRIINRTKVSVHGGVDIRGREGEDVRAANRGEVVLAEPLFFGGNTVIIDHGGGIYSIYMHLSRIDVEVREHVIAGQVVGLVGSSGRSTGPHLHFGVKVLGTNVDPLSVMRLALP